MNNDLLINKEHDLHRLCSFLLSFYQGAVYNKRNYLGGVGMIEGDQKHYNRKGLIENMSGSVSVNC
ncbi:hypothetical protein JCM16418A_32070 [Paenibacillus pini]